MVGDRLNTDMELAKNAGTNGILIACNAPEKLENDAIICSVQDLGELGRLMSCSL
jgi:phosphoglycolate phosphatase-like HAD superfamily hydrolase